MRDIGVAMDDLYGVVYVAIIWITGCDWDNQEELLGSNAMFPRPINRMLDDE